MKILLATITALALVVLCAAGANVDANHPDLSDLSDKADYEQNPAWYSKGWHDGWMWASALGDKSQTYSDTCDSVCRKKYGDIDEEGSKARTEFLGFLAAAAFVRGHSEGAADTQEQGTDKKKASDNSLERAIDAEERAIGTQGRATDAQERGSGKDRAPDNTLERAINAEERTIGAQERDTDKERVTDNTLEHASDSQGQTADTTTRIRPTPAAGDWDGCPGGWVTEEAIKQLMSDPNTCNFDSATGPQLTKYNGKKC